MILQSQTQNKAGRAILTLTQEDDLLKTKLRLYSFAALDADSKIGVFHNNQVYSGNMLLKDGAYVSSLVGEFNMDDDFYCAIVDTKNNNTPLLAGGTYGGMYFNDTSVITNNLSNNFSPNKIMPDAYETASPFTQPPHASQQGCQNSCANHNHTDSANPCIDNNYVASSNNRESNEFTTNANPCIGCKYKEYFYTQNPLPKDFNASSPTKQTSNVVTENQAKPATNTAIQEDTPKNEQAETTPTPPQSNNSILESLIPQFDYIFKTFPECTELNNAIENSRFVTITEGSSTYCLGAIYKDNQLQYICYAVPTAYNAPAPPELGEHHQWLPLDPADPLSDGYHIVFQDAHDLKIVEF